MLPSSRRVKKGPGRRPQSAKRQRFMELRQRGWGVDAAAREVGASRTAGRNWAKGYRKYRAGEVVGFVPALDRCARSVPGSCPRMSAFGHHDSHAKTLDNAVLSAGADHRASESEHQF